MKFFDMKIYYLLLIIIMVLGWNCGSDNTSLDNEETTDTTISSKELKKKKIAQELEENIIKSLPSPLEMTTIVKGSGIYFSKEMLNNTDNLEDYSTSFQKALNLGIYGADLGCINIYGKTHLALGYLSALKTLANDLKVGQFFDFATLKRLSNNRDNIDSILYISTSGFEKMNNYLNSRDRGNISILILVGGWLESLHLATNITSVDLIEHFFEEHPELVERIGEQKIILDDILLLLTVHKKSPGFSGLIEDFEELREIYKGVNITYTYVEPEMKEVDGVLMVEDKSTSIVDISPELLHKITSKVESIRKGIISQP